MTYIPYAEVFFFLSDSTFGAVAIGKLIANYNRDGCDQVKGTAFRPSWSYNQNFEENEDENGKAEMIKILEEKWDTLEKINSQILQELEKEEEIQMEIEDSDDLTNTNYRQAIDVLFERYGQNHKIIKAHIQTLIDIPFPKSNPDSLRNFFDRMECCIRALEALGTDEATYGTILTPMLYNKLPAEIRKNITRDKGDDQWELHSLRRAIKKELCVQDAGQAMHSKQEAQEFIPTANFVAGSSHIRTNKQEIVKQCLFCNGNHSPINCHNVQDYDKRISIIKQKRVCFNCFGNHKVSECQSDFKCRNCKKFQHTSICKNSQLPRSSSERDVTKSESTQSNQTRQREQSFQLHSSTQVTANTEVLLKTAVTPIWYGNQEISCNILLDEGAQNSFITEELAQKLHVISNGTVTLRMSAFGDKNSEICHLEKATVQL
ncbi:uncharacterized protein LOC134238068 [Saccostrea cucullata]|uniref:uncharacterized protein LOC134238068 n=1 Tax=Saccostrea cuccullata TaxID=36930 RepID=UPI002ED25645